LPNTEQSLQRALLCATAALDKKGLEPTLLDLTQEDSYTDYLLIVSAQSDRQVRAIADNVIEALGETSVVPLGVEGRREGRWALVDFGDVVVHVFYHPLREFYDIEGMWVDARKVPLQVPPDQRIRPHDLEDYGYSLAK
jgi:ribosome-associated protein